MGKIKDMVNIHLDVFLPTGYFISDTLFYFSVTEHSAELPCLLLSLTLKHTHTKKNLSPSLLVKALNALILKEKLIPRVELAVANTLKKLKVLSHLYCSPNQERI